MLTLYGKKEVHKTQTNSFTTNAKGTSLGGTETNNLKQPSTYLDCHLKTSWDEQTKKLQQINTQKMQPQYNTQAS